jgi:hypothetical protein
MDCDLVALNQYIAVDCDLIALDQYIAVDCELIALDQYIAVDCDCVVFLMLITQHMTFLIVSDHYLSSIQIVSTLLKRDTIRVKLPFVGLTCIHMCCPEMKTITC